MTVAISSTNKNSNVTVSGLAVTPSGGAPSAQYLSGLADTAVSGKQYFETTRTARDSYNGVIGLANSSMSFSSGNGVGNDTDGIALLPDYGSLWYNSGGVASSYPTGNTGTTFGWAVDASNGLFWVTADGSTWNAGGSASPTTGVGGYTIPFAGSIYPAYSLGYDGTNRDTWTFNFGATTLAYTVPSGFAAMNGGGLTIPAPTIVSVYNGGTSVANSGTTTSAALTVNVTLPAGAVAGDLLRLFDGGTQTGSDYTLTSTDITNGTASGTTSVLT